MRSSADVVERGQLVLLRIFLAVAAALNVGLFFLVRATWPDDWDPLGPRLLLSAVCVVGFVSTLHPTGRRHASTVGVVAACAMQVWYLHIAHVNGVSVERALNTLMLAVVAVAFCENTKQVAAFITASVAAVVWAYSGPHPDAMPQFALQVVLVVVSVGIGLVVHYRGLLERALASQVQHAETLALEVGRRREAELAALEASRVKSRFLANMSHELRTPLTAILGYGEIVDEELEGTESAPLRSDVERILVSARHLLSLIDEVLDLARIEAGQMEFQLEAVGLDALVQECVDLVGPSAEARGNRLVNEIHADRVWADRGRLKQILINLLSNAIKFTKEGTISVVARAEAERVRIAVSDTGCGIPAEALSTLFDPFVMVDRATRDAEGTGLGLAISHELVGEMGGALTAESVVGHGSVFTVVLDAR